MSTRIFACFDSGCDADLYALLEQQCAAPGSPLALVECSRGEGTRRSGWEERLRRRLESVDAAIVICTEHTEDAIHVNRELGILQEEGKPYLLLWGRRSGDCTKPLLAKSTDRFYTWIWEILTAQLDTALRTRAETRSALADLGGLHGKSRPR